MRICIVGVGGVGGYFGARLAAAGHSVAFVARGATLEALRTKGLHIESPLGNLHLAEVEASNNPSDIGPVDAVVLGVKAWQVPEVAETLKPLIGIGTVILPLQNGIEATDQLTAAVGPRSVLGGTCRISSTIVEPGRIRHLGVAPWIALGELDGSRSERVEILADAFSDAGIAVEVPPSIRAAVWEKFLLIASTSGVGGVTRMPLAEQRASPATMDLLRGAMQEVAALAVARGVNLPPDTVARTLDFVYRLPCDFTTSMQRDVMEGRPSELGSLSGAVVRCARESGVAAPNHGFLHAALTPQEFRACRPVRRAA